MAKNPALAARNAIEAARQRRVAKAGLAIDKSEWFIKEVSDKIHLHMHQRVRLATELIKERVVRNISIPVVRAQGRSRIGQFTRLRVVQRSKPGEYPRAETTRLMKSIKSRVKETMPGMTDGFVYTELGYGRVLEESERLRRHYLRRTLHENAGLLRRILTGPIK